MEKAIAHYLTLWFGKSDRPLSNSKILGKSDRHLFKSMIWEMRSPTI
ncbi:hypothetical protein [Merismopedia glauca]|nr:hypothetical protein [Merismopedia glauca]